MKATGSAFVALVFGAASCPRPATAEPPEEARRYEFHKDESAPALVALLPSPVRERHPALADDLACLRRAYPGVVAGVEAAGGNLFVFTADRARLPYDDGVDAPFQKLLEEPDLRDMLAQPYPLDNPTGTLPRNSDPGRIRPDEFFLLLYGGSRQEVEANLVWVDFCGAKVRFNMAHGAAGALAAVSKRLTRLFVEKPELRRYVERLGGTYNWRKIAKTDRLSAHSYGISIDLNPELGGYWQWSARDLDTFSREAYPDEIVEAFETHGFIWGGKWYHYDLMHFEYRPELIAKARAAAAMTEK